MITTLETFTELVSTLASGQVDPDSPIGTQLDSLALAELCGLIEEECGIFVDPTIFQTHQTVRSLWIEIVADGAMRSAGEPQ